MESPIQISEEDIQQGMDIFKDITAKVDDIHDQCISLLDKIKNDEINTSKGLSFLELKYQLLMSYIVNLTHIMYRKLSGKSIKEDTSVERLVEIRSVLEKARPIDQKLKYQIDKLVKTAMTGSVAENDPLSFKAHPENLTSKLSPDESDADSEEEEREGVYKPPKLSAVHYEGDTTEDRQNELIEKAKKRALSSNIMKELRMEHFDGPEEICNSKDLLRIKEDKEARERTRYEEERFVRLPVAKRKMPTAAGINTMSSLQHLTSFDDISALTNVDSFDPRSKKRKVQGKKGKFKGKKGNKKKRLK